jgi:hypothetical protein
MVVLQESPEPMMQLKSPLTAQERVLYQTAEVLTHGEDSQIRGSMIQHGNWRSCHGPADCRSNGFFSG